MDGRYRTSGAYYDNTKLYGRMKLEERERDEKVGLEGKSPLPLLFCSPQGGQTDMRQRKTMRDRQMSQSEIS